ncbi:triose-phosphate isomerase [Candidatus Falkowbacteria bacterium]|nr:triose-phosphate isomerase [Candidatus Falkowbacteria bacterium]
MKKNIFVANWKMNLTVAETKNLAEKLGQSLRSFKNDKTEIILCPAFTALDDLCTVLRKENPADLKIGAQDVFWEEKGAFTGEISAKMLKEVDCRYVIVGHSERRKNLGETDEMVNKKVKILLENDLVPIVCVGETFLERQKGLRDVIVARQTEAALRDVKLFGNKKIIIAYEPVWVIGTGQAVEPEDAEHSHRMIREALMENFPADVLEKHFQIIYGGSVDSKNIKDFVDRENIDGVLVGGASLKVEEFVKMIKQLA